MDLTVINLDQPRPAYRIIAAAIADEIRAGRLRPGQRIPSARTIANDVGVSLRTADAVLRTLRDDGLTVSVHGLGTFVAEDADAQAE
ncbi:GntR family transcriptional regulator [Actinomadura physcomitrii]|uniref:GntR family transcriptional regulator n=1 Tax=Actinomadura physcomitrii TaxID=2650748 RepID=UPI001369F33D|nr:GntR family transcriptional regulator [Actinomadura physcomitrii]